MNHRSNFGQMFRPLLCVGIESVIKLKCRCMMLLTKLIVFLELCLSEGFHIVVFQSHVIPLAESDGLTKKTHQKDEESQFH